MADLKCAAEKCNYNKEHYCCKGDIMVGGTHACHCDDTCCESFVEKKGDTFTNSLTHPSRTISIDCDAVKCKYNSNYKCVAEHVDIKGSGADTSSATACETFQEK